jgi:hypothetical protein
MRSHPNVPYGSQAYGTHTLLEIGGANLAIFVFQWFAQYRGQIGGGESKNRFAKTISEHG